MVASTESVPSGVGDARVVSSPTLVATVTTTTVGTIVGDNVVVAAAAEEVESSMDVDDATVVRRGVVGGPKYTFV